MILGRAASRKDALAISEYLREIRARIGSALLVLPSATGLVFDEKGRVLLVCHSNGGVWVMPGGAVDPEESPEDAAAREVWEETGLLVEPVRLYGVFGGPDFRVRYTNGDEVCYVMSVFECRRLGGELHADGEETLDVGFFSSDDLTAMNLSRSARAILPAAMSGKGQWQPNMTWRPPKPRV